MPQLTHALILTAGLGTRLLPLTLVRAKGALPVAGEPLIRRLVASLADAGVADVTLNLHHRPETLTSVLGDGRDLGVRVRYSWEHPRILGSAGGPRQALDIIGADTFFVLNGDTLSDVSMRAVADAHDASGALVTLALVPNTRHLHYGGVRLAGDGTVVGFVPRGPGAAGSFHFYGVQVVDRAVFADIPQGQAANSIGGVYNRLIAARPGSVRGLVSDAHYWDIGTVTDYWRTSWALLPDRSNSIGAATHIGTSARVTRSILWDDVEVGDHATLDECIVTDGVRIEAGASYLRTILVHEPNGQLTATPFATDDHA